jgi:hypothetical protein
MKCELCDGNSYEYSRLGSHLNAYHTEITHEDYYRKFLMKEGEDICIHPSCSNKRKFFNLQEGYAGQYCGLKCFSTTDEKRKISSESFALTNRIHAERFSSIVSERMKTLHLNPDFTKKVIGNFKGTRGEYYSKRFDKSFIFRSSYEKRSYEILEKDSSVISYEVEPFAIDYTLSYEGVEYSHRYFPDLLIHYKNGSVLVEVKPNDYIHDYRNIQKFLSAYDYCTSNNMKFEVWTEDYLYQGVRDPEFTNLLLEEIKNNVKETVAEIENVGK